MRTYVATKIHGIRATKKGVRYHGSVSIGRDFLAAVGIEEYEQVHVVNLTNGQRWVTYAIACDDGEFHLNGGGARLGELGDEFVLMTYEQLEHFRPARVAFVNEANEIFETARYETPATEHPTTLADPFEQAQFVPPVEPPGHWSAVADLSRASRLGRLVGQPVTLYDEVHGCDGWPADTVPVIEIADPLTADEVRMIEAFIAALWRDREANGTLHWVGDPDGVRRVLDERMDQLMDQFRHGVRP